VKTTARHPTEHSDLKKPDFDELPSASLEFVDSTKPRDIENTSPLDSNKSAFNPPHADDSSQQDNLLATGSVSQLIDESLNIRDRIGTNSSVVAFMLCSKRAKISRRLMEMELSPNQRVFALVSYIESISMIDSLNVQGQLHINGPRAALVEVGEKYCDHPDSNVRSKANLAMVLAPAYDFLVSGDPELLKQFQIELDAKVDHMINDRQAASRLLTTAVFVHDKVGFESLTWPIALDIVERFEKSTLPEIKILAANFRERLYFGSLDLNSLTDRINVDDARSRGDVQKFLDALAVNPDSRLEVYLVGVAVTKKYQELGRQDDAQAVVTRLRDI